MSLLKKFNSKLRGLTNAVFRFPLTTLFLVAAAVMNAHAINTGQNHSKWLLTFVVGAFLSAVFQAIYERFFSKISARVMLMGIVPLLTAGYYLIIMSAPELSIETQIRTAVSLFALFIAFIWVPAIKSNISFNKSFMIAFKSFFHSLFFSVIIFIGVWLILIAADTLIFPVDSKSYLHVASIIFMIFTPMYFLSMIPAFSKEEIDEAARVPKFLEILISYVAIPLLTVFTLILLIYIIKNISGKFWTDNLLEPMLVSYAITVILLYLLASELENKFTAIFREIFPKMLVIIVLFQIASSILGLEDKGMTHTRYFVILFGIYAAIAGVLLSFLPVQKNGVIAGMLIMFAAVSIVPPVDAFTVSRISQTNMLKNALVKNHMLKNNKIQPNASISDRDKKMITNAVDYLYMMGYSKNMNWLPADFNAYQDFDTTFGFKRYQESTAANEMVFLRLKQPSPIPITGFDTFVQTEIHSGGHGTETICEMKKAGETYALFNDQQNQIILTEKNGGELIRFNTQEIFDRFKDYSSAEKQMTATEATFTKENDQARLTIVVQDAEVEKQKQRINNAMLYVFVEVK